jgi:DNA-directed RNA polymerase subunit M/transcription elongation factor TFIIS
MKFCKKCDNMYYMKLSPDETAKIVLYCRKCGDEDDNATGDACIISTKIGNIDESMLHVNKYTKYDPTLPHTDTIHCPNDDCLSNKGTTPRDVLYLRYDDINLKYVYLCSICDSVWNMKKS